MQIANLGNFKRIVIKIGSSLLVDQQEMRADWLASFAEDVHHYLNEDLGIIASPRKNQEAEIIIVTSGSIAKGRIELGWHDRVLRLDEKQAAAAIGQTGLMDHYRRALSHHGLPIAQILLTIQDTEERRRHLNARSAIMQLLELGYVPIINENDTVATSEIRYGDNDRLAARVACMLSADLLILLSDVDGLYSADPRKDTKARHYPKIEQLTPEIINMAGGAPEGYSSGGMVTKLEAARIAMQGGCHMIIAKGAENHPLKRLVLGEKCTHFLPQDTPLQARKGWIAGALKPKGQLIIDAGAFAALNRGNSLLPSGVKQVLGQFERGDTISLYLEDNPTIAVAIGLSAYNAKEANQIKGHHSSEIPVIIGYGGRSVLIHRDDLVIL